MNIWKEWSRFTWHLVWDYNFPIRLVKPIYCLKQYLLKRPYKVGMIVEDCNYHPAIITSIDRRPEDDGIDVRSLITGNESSCSLRNCSCTILTVGEVFARLDAYEKGGEKELMKIAGGWDEESASAFMAGWRDNDPSF